MFGRLFAPAPDAPPHPGPRFSVIVIHYQPSIPHQIFLRGIESLRTQAFRDFELLVYHDGPLTDPGVVSPVPIVCSTSRFNDWGHSLRDRGIREASGEYIVHFNADNILYPDALEEIDRAIRRPPRAINKRGQVLDPNHIIVFPIKMFGWTQLMKGSRRDLKDPDYYQILTGNPPRFEHVDAMQFVMRRDLWLREGGWYDKRANSDGIMYERLALKYGYRAVGPVLGEHH
ncbi:MAG: glycosyltransferase family A protein [Phycisphaerales bacterium]